MWQHVFTQRPPDILSPVTQHSEGDLSSCLSPCLPALKCRLSICDSQYQFVQTATCLEKHIKMRDRKKEMLT